MFVIDHCLDEFEIEQKEKIYWVYVTEGLRAIADNTMRFAGGTSIKARYIDLIDPKPQENRTGEQIVADVVKKAGLKVVSK